MSRKLALPVFLLAAVLCAVWSFIEAKQPTPASLREQLIGALDSVDAVSFQPDRLDSNHAEGPVTDAKYVEEICALLRQLEPADDVAWPAGEEQYLFSKASFVLLSGHGSEELTTADGTAETPRCYILNDRGNDRTLLFVHNGSRSYENKDFRLIGALPFTGLDYTIAMDQKLQSRTGSELLTLTEEVGGQIVTLKVYEPDEEGIARYALFGADGTEIDIPFGVDRGTWLGNGDAAEKVSLTAWDDLLGFPGFEVTTVNDASHLKRIFYALTGGGTPVNVADSFGLSFGPDDDYNYAVPVDLNGDGRSELLTRVSYSGSGVDRVLAFRWNAESSVSEEGRLFWDTETLFQHTGPLGERQRLEEYDAERGVFVLKYERYDAERDVREWESEELPLAMESFEWLVYDPED